MVMNASVPAKHTTAERIDRMRNGMKPPGGKETRNYADSRQNCKDQDHNRRAKWSALTRARQGDSVLHCHGVGVHSLLAGNALESGQHSSIIILVTLHGETALVVTVDPCQTYKMLL